MNIKASTKYQAQQIIKPALLYYAIVLVVYLAIATIISFVLSSYGMQSTLNGTESSTFIFLFVLGLCTFKENFFMHMQHGLSRRTQFVSRLVTIAATAFGAAILDKIVLYILKLYATVTGAFSVYSAYEMSYPISGVGGELMHLAGLFTTFLFVLALGYFITVLFYRLNTGAKVAIGVGVPVLVFMVYPIVDTLILKGVITRFLLEAYSFLFGSAWMSLISYVALAAVFSLFAWLMMRRVTVKG